MSTHDDTHLHARVTFDAQALVTAHPPRLRHASKQVVHAIACPPGAVHRGALVVSRWRAMTLPPVIPGGDGPEHEMREDVFSYEPAPTGASPPAVEWYVNFADVSLFVAYGGPLLAQDEMQVAEHPALGSLREALAGGAHPGLPATTRDGPLPAPVLIRGVERRCAIDTDHEAAFPHGLYGNRFARASHDVLRKATRALDPPTITNLLAMEAPPGGGGAYTTDTIIDVLVTAFTGFSAAGVESRLACPGATPAVVVHTGHWGTGAYGGNKVLMALLQMIAARLAGLDRLVFHTFDAAGSEAWRDARAHADDLIAAHRETAPLIQAIADMGFEWGFSDGN